MTATTTTTPTTRTASGWTLALWASLTLVIGAGVGSAATAALTNDGSGVAAEPRVAADVRTEPSSSAAGDLVAPDAIEHRIAAGGPTAVVAPLAATGVYTADAAERWLTADASDRRGVCTSAIVAADAVEHCLAGP
jgi:hypothetical protein